MLNARKIAALAGMAIVAGTLVIVLPQIRLMVWGKDGPTKQTSLEYDPVVKAEQEAAIASEMKRDTSQYDRGSDLRVIERLPISEVELEAVFRNRKGDACEKIVTGDTVLSNEIKASITPRDNTRLSLGGDQLGYARRPVLSLSLKVKDQDQRSLPRLTKGQILDFLDSTWLSLQARVQVYGNRQEWRLHYRPLAAQASFQDRIQVQAYESTIERTIEDFRGLGLLKDGDAGTEVSPAVSRALPAVVSAPSIPLGKPQTAVWLFRSEQSDFESTLPRKAFEFVFVHARPTEGSSDELNIELHTICTSNQRKSFHYFGPQSSDALPSKAEDTSLSAAVHFTKYGTGGLSPTESVTRGIEFRASKNYSLAEIQAYLKNQGLEGAWQDHPLAVVEHLVQGR